MAVRYSFKRAAQSPLIAVCVLCFSSIAAGQTTVLVDFGSSAAGNTFGLAGWNTAILSANLAYTTVIFSSLFGVWFWDETLPLGAWVAIALIIASGVAVSIATRDVGTPAGERLQARHSD